MTMRQALSLGVFCLLVVVSLRLCACTSQKFALPPETPCILNALDTLPADYEAITVGNVENLVKAIQGCKTIQRDAGQ